MQNDQDHNGMMEVAVPPTTRSSTSPMGANQLPHHMMQNNVYPNGVPPTPIWPILRSPTLSIGAYQLPNQVMQNNLSPNGVQQALVRPAFRSSTSMDANQLPNLMMQNNLSPNGVQQVSLRPTFPGLDQFHYRMIHNIQNIRPIFRAHPPQMSRYINQTLHRQQLLQAQHQFPSPQIYVPVAQNQPQHSASAESRQQSSISNQIAQPRIAAPSFRPNVSTHTQPSFPVVYGRNTEAVFVLPSGVAQMQNMNMQSNLAYAAFSQNESFANVRLSNNAPVHGYQSHVVPIYAAPLNAAPLNAAQMHSTPSNYVPVYAAPLNAAQMHSTPSNSVPVYAAVSSATEVHTTPSNSAPVYVSRVRAPPSNAVRTNAIPRPRRPIVTPAIRRSGIGYGPALHPHIWTDFGYFNLPSTSRENGRHYVMAKWVEDALFDLVRTDDESGENPLYTVTQCITLHCVKVNEQETILFDILGTLGTGEIRNQCCHKNDRLVSCMDVSKFIRFVLHSIALVWGENTIKPPFQPPWVIVNQFGFIKFTDGNIVPYAIMEDAGKFVPTSFFKSHLKNHYVLKRRMSGVPLAYVKYCCLCLNFPETQEILRKNDIEVCKLEDVSQFLSVIDYAYWPKKDEYHSDFMLKAKVLNKFPTWLDTPL